MSSTFSIYSKIYRLAYGINQPVAHRLAYNLFTRPLFQIRAAEELRKLAEAEISNFSFESHQIRIYTFGQGTIPLLLVHGWRGHAGNFFKLVDSFDLIGYRIIAFDAPAHNASSGKRTNPFEIARLVEQLIKTYEPAYIISHSMGSAAVVMALHKLPQHSVEKLILLSTPNSLEYLVKSFTNRLGFTDPQRRSFLEYVEQKQGKSFEETKIANLVSRINIPVFIIHDKYDRVLSFHAAQEVASASKDRARLYVAENVGHYRMLSNPKLIGKIKEFIYEEI